MIERKHRTQTPRAYHHGSLRSALLASAQQVLAEKGVEGFSLRETARRAGVSAAAPKHHFADTRALLTSLASMAFRELANRLEAADRSARSRQNCIRAQGVAYVRFALDNPSLFDLMWRATLLDLDNADLIFEKERSFAVLDRRVRGRQTEPVSHTDPAMAPTIACWSLVHGFARMALDGAFGVGLKMAREAAKTLLPDVLDLLVTRDLLS